MWDIALSTPPVNIISPIDMASSTIGITSVDAAVPYVLVWFEPTLVPLYRLTNWLVRRYFCV